MPCIYGIIAQTIGLQCQMKTTENDISDMSQKVSAIIHLDNLLKANTIAFRVVYVKVRQVGVEIH